VCRGIRPADVAERTQTAGIPVPVSTAALRPIPPDRRGRTEA
jgi:hypothetical protein